MTNYTAGSIIKSLSQYKQALSEAVSAQIILAMFHAEWADESKLMMEVLRVSEEKYPGRVKALVIDAEEAEDLTLQFGVELVPTVVIGKINASGSLTKIDSVVGYSPQQLHQSVEKALLSVGPVAEQSGIPTGAELLTDKLKRLTSQSKVVLFMKGNPDVPKCGFSRTMISLLNSNLPQDYKSHLSTFDILEDEQVRQGLKEYSSWPTYPQLYVNGEFVGGLDICKEMIENGEFQELFQ
ncbi:hypothetical protein MP228_012336 [Amoeboaphelidium protococcarum]|nr:hypothetical protein MP228_012336 [Amoeboaphelidium protococcarum]